MKIKDRLNDYLNDNEYKIIIKENYINIINYDEITDFTTNKIGIKYKNKIILIEGINLTITKMVTKEVLVTGNIMSIRIN